MQPISERPVRVMIFDIGGVLTLDPNGGEPTTALGRWLSTWDARMNSAPGTFEKRFHHAQRTLLGAGKDGRIGTCSEEEWHTTLGATLSIGSELLPRFIEEFWDAYMGAPNVELLGFVRTLRPRYRTALLSNSFVGAREREQARFDFASLFDDAIYSHEVGLLKPEEAIYALTCARLGVHPSETIFVDDRAENVDAANAFGMRAILFRETKETIQAIERRERAKP